MAQSSFILPKVMDAIRDALRAKAFSWIDDPTRIRSSLTGGPLDLDVDAAPDSTPTPNVTCEAIQADVNLPNIANYRVQCSVIVSSSADSEQADGERTTYQDHAERAGQVFDVLYADDFVASLCNSGLTVFGIYHTSQSQSVEVRRWVSRHSFYVECAGSQIS